MEDARVHGTPPPRRLPEYRVAARLPAGALPPRPTPPRTSATASPRRRWGSIMVTEGELGEAVVAAVGQIVATTLVVGFHGKSFLYSGNLSGLNLGGEISPAIGDLKSVVSIDPKSNGLSGRSLMRLVIVHPLKY